MSGPIIPDAVIVSTGYEGSSDDGSPLGALRRSAGGPAKPLFENNDSQIFLEGRRHAILCRRCGREITRAEYAVTVQGKHEHVFTNPMGVTYQIGCFSQAGGAVNQGTPVLEFTWFAGFAWSVSLCSGCYLHLGWFYQSAETSFFGLITANLLKPRFH